LQLLAQKGVCAYFNLRRRDERAKRKPAKRQGGSRNSAGETQWEGTQGVRERLQAGLGLGLRLLQPTWSCGAQGNGTSRTFPLNTQNCIKDIPGCHHQRILPAQRILARPRAGPASQAESQQYVRYKFLHLPVFHRLPHSPHQLAIPKVTVEVGES